MIRSSDNSHASLDGDLRRRLLLSFPGCQCRASMASLRAIKRGARGCKNTLFSEHLFSQPAKREQWPCVDCFWICSFGGFWSLRKQRQRSVAECRQHQGAPNPKASLPLGRVQSSSRKPCTKPYPSTLFSATRCFIFCVCGGRRKKSALVRVDSRRPVASCQRSERPNLHRDLQLSVSVSGGYHMLNGQNKCKSGKTPFVLYPSPLRRAECALMSRSLYGVS